jgi:ubiquinol-cytochrome c reductase cytochrome b subunit
VPFHPYYTIKDGFALVAFILVFAAMVFYAPNFLGHPDNYVPANPLQTPPHIVPEWYFLPFYAILRAIPNKLFGVIALLSSISILFFVPWLDTSKVRSTSYRPIYRWFMFILVIDVIVLGFCGANRRRLLGAARGQHALCIFHFVILRVLGKIERPLPLPPSIADAVLKKAS